MRTTRTGSATRIHATFAAITVLALSAAPVALHAQQALEPVKVHAGASQVANPAADALAAEAKQHYATPKRWREAARLHRRAADLHGEDPQARSLALDPSDDVQKITHAAGQAVELCHHDHVVFADEVE